MLKFIKPMILTVLSACYQAPNLEGWDATRWNGMALDCENDRVELAKNIVIPQQRKLLGKNQNEIDKLLGAADRHELYERNQKFFYYRLDCINKQELSVRFDALGRVKEIQVIKTQ